MLNIHTQAGRHGRPLHRARDKTGRIQQRLAVAGAELELTSSVLDRHLPDSVKRVGDVQRALSHNGVIEEKVQQAADELQVVKDLLQEEVAERERLERELERRPPA